MEGAISDLEDDARELEEAQERGGILTHEERIQRAAKEGRKSYGFSFPNCGAALPESTTEICGYCESVLTDNSGKISKGWVLLQEKADKTVATPDTVYQAGKERLEALRQTYLAQLKVEETGLMAVLEAGKKRTLEFDHAMDDAKRKVNVDRYVEMAMKEVK